MYWVCAEGGSRTTGASVAERELKAALGALGARRTRKEVGGAEGAHPAAPPLAPIAAPAPHTLQPPPTFRPAAVSAETNKQWNDFIAANDSQRLQISIYVTFLALINCLQRYEYSNISVKPTQRIKLVPTLTYFSRGLDLCSCVVFGTPAAALNSRYSFRYNADEQAAGHLVRPR